MAGRLAPIQRRAVRRMGHIHVSYPSSPLTHPDGNREGVQPGQRAPDLEVTSHGQKTRLYEVLRRGQHVLLISVPDPGGNWQPRMRPWHDRVEVVTAAHGRPGQPGHHSSGSVCLLLSLTPEN